MKILLFLLSFLLLVSTGCEKEAIEYELSFIHHIPDSLKQQHRDWIQETVRAASQHMTGGKYESPHKTIREARYTADDLFGKNVLGLRKYINGNQWENVNLLPEEMSEEEKIIFERLIKENKEKR
jgi:hypothetical protein